MAKEKKPNPANDKERTSLFIDPDLSRSVKYIAFMDGRTQTEVITEAILEHVAKYEKKHGPIPKRNSL